MNKIETRKGAKFVGEVPKVFVQAPFREIKGNSGICNGCDNMVAFLNIETALCPYCVGKEIEDKQ